MYFVLWKNSEERRNSGRITEGLSPGDLVYGHVDGAVGQVPASQSDDAVHIGGQLHPHTFGFREIAPDRRQQPKGGTVVPQYCLTDMKAIKTGNQKKNLLAPNHCRALFFLPSLGPSVRSSAPAGFQ